MNRKRFCEMLTSMANCPITEREFEISAPIAIDGVKTAVMVRPLNRTRRYGFQQVEYTRFDLSTRPELTLRWRGEGNTQQLVERLDMPSHFPYRIGKGLGSIDSTPRKLRLQPADVEYAPLIVNTGTTQIVLKAQDTSDFFIGSWSIILQRTF